MGEHDYWTTLYIHLGYVVHCSNFSPHYEHLTQIERILVYLRIQLLDKAVQQNFLIYIAFKLQYSSRRCHT